MHDTLTTTSHASPHNPAVRMSFHELTQIETSRAVDTAIAHGVTATDLARRLGCSQSNVSRDLSGQSYLSYPTLCGISNGNAPRALVENMPCLDPVDLTALDLNHDGISCGRTDRDLCLARTDRLLAVVKERRDDVKAARLLQIETAKYLWMVRHPNDAAEDAVSHPTKRVESRVVAQ